MLRSSFKQQLDEFGYAGPFTLKDPKLAKRAAERLDSEILVDKPGKTFDPHISRHVDCKSIYEICTDESLLDKICEALGPEIILWNSVLFDKLPGGSEIPWHQDHGDVFLDPLVNLAGWVALTDCHSRNGCLEFIPGSHRQILMHHPKAPYQFSVRARTEYIDTKNSWKCELTAGQFVIFDSYVLHRSAANLSLDRRTGLVARFTVPGVKIQHPGVDISDAVIHVRGNTKSGL